VHDGPGSGLAGAVRSPVTNAVMSVNGDQFNATISTTNAQQFFRLGKQ
jgi:hypothetical protein